jgi:MYXO-CTERM domain-containing protein
MRRIRSGAAILLAAAAPLAADAATVINFTNFSNCATLQLNGNAACVSNVLRVTPATFSQSGSAFSLTLIPLGPGNSFSTVFSFRISNSGGAGDGDGLGADGLTFTVQPNAATAGGGGGGIGYQGIPNSVALEFDTWNNGVAAGDPDGNHVGVDVNGSVFSVATAPIATRMNDGNVWWAWIDYDGATLTLRVSQSAVRPASPTLSYAVNLASVLGTTQTYVGFTSGTGAAFGDHDVLTWQFDNTFNPFGASPAVVPTVSPAMLAGIALALAALGAAALRRRRRA